MFTPQHTLTHSYTATHTLRKQRELRYCQLPLTFTIKAAATRTPVGTQMPAGVFVQALKRFHRP